MKKDKNKKLRLILAIVVTMLILITFFSGCTTNPITRRVCTQCDGSGKCNRCDGRGWAIDLDLKCDYCDGSGRCPRCGGLGEVDD